MLQWSWVISTARRLAPCGALVFSLWRTPGTNSFSVRVQFITQTLEQMHAATPPSLENPPVIADLFVPGCSTAAEGSPCGWSAFQSLAAVLSRDASLSR